MPHFPAVPSLIEDTRYSSGDRGDAVTSTEEQLSSSRFPSGVISLTVQDSEVVAEGKFSLSRSLGSENSSQDHGVVVEKAHVRGATPTPPQSSVGTLEELRATETRLRQAQEAELSVLTRLHLLTEGLVSALQLSTGVGLLGEEATVAHGGGNTEGEVGLAVEGFFRPSLPTLVAYPSTGGAGGVMHLTVRRVTMPLAGLSAATREQYTALHNTLAQHFDKREADIVSRTSHAAASGVCTPVSTTPQRFDPSARCDVTPSALILHVSPVVGASSIGASTAACKTAEEAARVAAMPTVPSLNTAEAQGHTQFFPREMRDCSSSSLPRSRGLLTGTTTDGFPKPEAPTAATGSVGGSVSWRAPVKESPPAPSHVYGPPQKLLGDEKDRGSPGRAPMFPELLPPYTEDMPETSAAVDRRNDIREATDRGHRGEDEGGVPLASSTPTEPTSPMAAPTLGSLPCAVSVAFSSPMFVSTPPLGNCRAATANPPKEGNFDPADEQDTQDTLTPSSSPPTSRIFPNRLSQPLSATPPSDLGDAGEEEEMYFPAPPVRGYCSGDSGRALSAHHHAMSDGRSADKRTDSACMFSKSLNTILSTTSLCRRAADNVHYAANGNSEKAPQSQRRSTGAVASSTTHTKGQRQEAPVPMVSTKQRSCVSLPSPTPTCVSNATDILATITPLPLSSASSQGSKSTLARSAHRGSGVHGGALTRCAKLDTGHCPSKGAYKRIRGEDGVRGRAVHGKEIYTAKPLEGLPFLGVDVSLSAVAAWDRSVPGRSNDAQLKGLGMGSCTEKNGLAPIMSSEQDALCSYVRTREQRVKDVAQAERVFGAVRAACGSLLTDSHAGEGNAECDISESLLSPSHSQNTPHQFWDIGFP